MIVACLPSIVTLASANEIHSFGLQKAIKKNHEMLQFNLIINPRIIFEMKKYNITTNDIGIQWGDYITLDKLHREPRAIKRGDTIIAGIDSVVAVEIMSGKLVTLYGNQVNGMVHSLLGVEKANSIGQSTIMASDIEEIGLRQLQRELVFLLEKEWI
uniref:Peptidase_M23 domain-containing protein n=1 Tax=Caenorhabditis tropicalis TaxID=1561998 RepID=A0A1I7U2V3_9PELO